MRAVFHVLLIFPVQQASEMHPCRFDLFVLLFFAVQQASAMYPFA
jgi:hypothetical protein